jgi:E3 ubiquitin-protein ligase MARCH6
MTYIIFHFINSSKLQLNHTSDFITKPLNFFIPWSGSSNVTASTSVSASLSWLDSLPDYLGPFEPYFVGIGSEVRELVTSAQATWIRLAIGSRPTNRAFAILLGYVDISFAFCVYLNIVTVGNAQERRELLCEISSSSNY